MSWYFWLIIIFIIAIIITGIVLYFKFKDQFILQQVIIPQPIYGEAMDTVPYVGATNGKNVYNLKCQKGGYITAFNGYNDNPNGTATALGITCSDQTYIDPQGNADKSKYVYWGQISSESGFSGVSGQRGSGLDSINFIGADGKTIIGSSANKTGDTNPTYSGICQAGDKLIGVNITNGNYWFLNSIEPICGTLKK